MNPRAIGRGLTLGSTLLKPIMPLIPSIDRFAGSMAMAWHVAEVEAQDNPWDACHSLLEDGQSSNEKVEMAEPDLSQSWLWASSNRQALGVIGGCDSVPHDNDVYPMGNTNLWFADDTHSELERARSRVVSPDPTTSPRNIVRIAHLDTGYDDNHATKPRWLNSRLARNFVDDDRPNDATDKPSARVNRMLSHGTGTLSILAGKDIDGVSLGAAGNLEVVPVRVANWLAQFYTSAIARAFDYVHSLCDCEETRIHVLTMSMGGIASAVWADAVNALYEKGVFVVTAAGNNFGGLPTRFTIYPARFSRVLAAYGIMADGRPYADLPIRKMAGCRGPRIKNATSMAAFTPNVPWAKFGCCETVDGDGGGTSAATPQLAAAAALWIQKNKAAIESYNEDWMRVEATRKALFDGASRRHWYEEQGTDYQDEYVGRGSLRADAALNLAPARVADLEKRKTAPDAASFGLSKLLEGLGMEPISPRKQRMFELEALQISQQSYELERVLAESELFNSDVSPDLRVAHPVQARQIVEALLDHPNISVALKRHLAAAAGNLESLPASMRTVESED